MSSIHWVTVDHFPTTAQALFFKNVLEGNGIPAFIPDQYFGQLMPQMTAGLFSGGIRLQVPEDCLHIARDILTGDSEQSFEDEDDESCPES